MNFFKKIVYIFIFITSYFSFAQTVRVIDNKGTIKEVDNSKWSTSGNDIYNKNSGNIGIGATPDSSAKLEVKSTTSGFLPPRLTTSQRDAIVLPATGLVVFNLTTNALEINSGTTLVPVWTSSFTPDATTTSKGILQLAGDLAGVGSSATNPIISNSAVSTSKIADANVTNAKLATDAVTSGKILDGTIIVDDLANNAVETTKIKDLNVTTAKLADAAVTTTKIASGGNSKVLVTDSSGVVAWIDGTAFGAVADLTTIEGAGTAISPFKVKDLGIITAKLADNAVTTIKIADANVTNAKLATDAVTSGKILDGTIIVDDLANNAVETTKIKDLNVTTAKLADAAVTTTKIASGGNSKVLVTDSSGVVAWIDGTAFGAVADLTTIEGAGTAISPFKVKDLGIITAKLADNAVTTIKIADSNVTNAKLATDAVTTIKIADANVTNAKLATDAVTTEKILDGTIIGSDLANSIITNAKLAETISVPNGGTGATTLTGYVKGNGTNAMTAVATIPVADIVGAQTIANLASNITANTGSTTLYPSVAAVEAYVTNSATPDASTTVKGKVKLAGDLGGTADLPTVPGLATKEPTIAAGTTTQYWRGDKSWQTLDKSTVGLNNVDNTSDANKPISTATQTALNNKEDLANKSTNTALGTSNALYPTQNAVKTYVDAQITSNSTPDASTTVKGKIQLAGDLGGTAAAPSVVKLQGTAVSATTPTTGQLLQFDGTNWKPVNANSIVKMETDEFVATAAQVSFTLTATPIGKIAMYVNGVRVPKAAITVTGTTVAYTSSSNGGYVVLVNDRITFDYITN